MLLPINHSCFRTRVTRRSDHIIAGLGPGQSKSGLTVSCLTGVTTPRRGHASPCIGSRVSPNNLSSGQPITLTILIYGLLLSDTPWIRQKRTPKIIFPSLHTLKTKIKLIYNILCQLMFVPIYNINRTSKKGKFTLKNPEKSSFKWVEVVMFHKKSKESTTFCTWKLKQKHVHQEATWNPSFPEAEGFRRSEHELLPVLNILSFGSVTICLGSDQIMKHKAEKPGCMLGISKGQCCSQIGANWRGLLCA